MKLPPKTKLDEDGGLPRYAWPGGYPVYYILGDGETLCSKCARHGAEYRIGHEDREFRIVGYEVNWGDPRIYCVSCNDFIESPYDTLPPDPEPDSSWREWL